MNIVASILTRIFNVQKIPYDVGMYVVRQQSEQLYIECNSMIMINQGQTTAIVDQLSIPPNKFLSIPGELFEEMNHRFRITFNGSGENNLVCVFKVYR